MNILLIEDDEATARFVVTGLTEDKHTVTVAINGQDGFVAAASKPWDLIIVDRMLPTLDGLSLVRRLRAGEVTTPVLFLTTMDGIDDRVHGLNAGADDYLVKPFAIRELLARTAALHRRMMRTPSDPIVRVDDLEVNLLSREVRRAGAKIDLQQREFQILDVLLKNAGQIVTKTMLLQRIWNFHFDPQTNLVESHISRLRSKVDRGHRELIHTVRGAGYCLREPD